MVSYWKLKVNTKRRAIPFHPPPYFGNKYQHRKRTTSAIIKEKKGIFTMDVEPNLCFGQLETKWSWKNKRYGRIWKCTCECGGYCYVKEEALVMGIVKDCGGICHQDAVKRVRRVKKPGKHT
nr:MAG TPA: hypothetical protein [Caudoviricetes sp.]